MRKSELIALLNAFEGDPDVMVFSGVYVPPDPDDVESGALSPEDGEFDDVRAHTIREVHDAWSVRQDGDTIAIEIARNVDFEGRDVGGDR